MKDRLGQLWRGEIDLLRAFWDYAIIYGSLANLIATSAALAILASDLPGLLALAVFLLPLPYTIVVLVGVWRSANRYRGPPHWATMARIAIVAWAVIATLA
jgi:hypothetical protein